MVVGFSRTRQHQHAARVAVEPVHHPQAAVERCQERRQVGQV